MRHAIEAEKLPIEIELIDTPYLKSAQRHIRYRILKVLSQKGKSCVCYIAEKMSRYEEGKLVVLKEFFPYWASDDLYTRNDQGILTFLADERISLQRESFISNIRKIQEYVCNPKYREIRQYLCVDDDISPLYAPTEEGNGSVYYENLFVSGQYWVNLCDKGNNDIVLSQVLQTASSVMEFLKRFHAISPKTAYIDIKPEDILVRRDEQDVMNFSNVLLFDFNSCRLFGTYPQEEVLKLSTEAYSPKYFFTEKEIDISVGSENCTFGKVLTQIIQHKDRSQKITMEGKVITSGDAVNTSLGLWGCDRGDEGIATMEEKEIVQRIDTIKEALEETERDRNKHKLKPIYHWLGKICCSLLVLLTGGFFYHMYLALTDHGVQHTKKILELFTILLLIIIDTGIVYLWARQHAHLAICIKYYDKRDATGNLIRNAEYNTFRLSMTRKGDTFQDKSDLHLRQQKRRRQWWLILVVWICGVGVLLSIAVEALPVLFATGLALIILFMWADYLQNRGVDYERYLMFVREGGRSSFFDSYCSDTDEATLHDSAFQKAVFYGDEYITGGFNLSESCYYNKFTCRNLYRLQEWLKENGYPSLEERNLPNKRHYDDRIEHITSKQTKNLSLGYCGLHMKQIYKMTFDRLKNIELITVLSITTLLLLSSTFAALFTSSKGIVFTRVPTKAYIPVTMGIAVITGIYNIIRAFLSESYEYYIMEMAYKSRYVDENSMNELLQKDIVAGYILPIDIVRGTTRYQGSVIGRIDGETITERNIKIENFRRRTMNRPLLHHRVISNARRFSITTWCSFGIVSFTVVWLLGHYYMFFPLLVLTIIVHYRLQKVVLPNYKNKTLMTSLENICGEKNNGKR